MKHAILKGKLNLLAQMLLGAGGVGAQNLRRESLTTDKHGFGGSRTRRIVSGELSIM